MFVTKQPCGQYRTSCRKMLNSHLLKYNQLIINKLFTHHKVLFVKLHKQLIISNL